MIEKLRCWLIKKLGGYPYAQIRMTDKGLFVDGTITCNVDLDGEELVKIVKKGCYR